MTYKTNREQGVVSLLTVMFFMIFVSMIVVGYLGLVTSDQRQTIDSELSASALAAAKSGIEDGKRILLYCHKNPAAAGCDASVLNSADNCDVFKGSGSGVTLANQLSIPIDTTTGQGATGGATDYKQYFTCLTIQRDTQVITAPLTPQVDYIQQLRTTAPFNKLRVNWQNTGSYANRGALTAWPQLSAWSSGGVAYPPVLQMQIIPYVASSFTTGADPLSDIEHASKTVYLVPCGPSSALPVACTVASKDINVLDQRNAAGSTRVGTAPITYASCSVGSIYDCTIDLTGFSGGPAATQYYIRVSLLYGASTQLKLMALDGSTQVYFNDIQPWIDVTGRTNDVFRRVRAEVSYASNDIVLPSSALESAAPICKDMVVTADALSSTYNCN